MPLLPSNNTEDPDITAENPRLIPHTMLQENTVLATEQSCSALVPYADRYTYDHQRTSLSTSTAIDRHHIERPDYKHPPWPPQSPSTTTPKTTKRSRRSAPPRTVANSRSANTLLSTRLKRRDCIGNNMCVNQSSSIRILQPSAPLLSLTTTFQPTFPSSQRPSLIASNLTHHNP